MAYSEQTVAQLKEELTSRQLSTSGVKKDLIQRLETDDASKQSNPEAEEPKEELLEEPKEQEPQEESNKPEESKEEAKEESKEETNDEPKPKTIKEYTPEERKTLAIEFLNKKIQRSKKFGGDEEEIESLKKDLTRIEKYGVELGTSIAKEIGLTSKPLHDGPRRKFHGKHRGRGNRGFRGGRN